MDERPKRSPSASFPAVALPEAVKTITEIAKYGNRHPRTAFAQYLGHDSAYSGPFKSKLASYRDWGLVTTAPDTVELTPLAVRLALPPDPAKVSDDLRAAFRSCESFVAMYEACAKGQPLELETIANMAVHRVGIAAAAKDRFVGSFAQSVIAAGLGEAASGTKLVLFSEPRAVTSAAGRENRAQAVDAVSPPSDQSGLSRTDLADGGRPEAAVSLSWELEEGDISFVIRHRRPLGSSAFAKVATVTDAIEALAAELGTSDPKTANSASQDEQASPDEERLVAS
jgi:hypothetical protein